MANEVPSNNGASTSSGGLTAAERLRQKHEAETAHNPTVEDTIDEEDLAHPPPSMIQAAKEPASSDSIINGMSAKAAGKQKASEEPTPLPSSRDDNAAAPLNTKSEEAFPSLGSGLKPNITSQAPLAWGSKKPSSIHAGPNNQPTSLHTPDLHSSRASAPTSGVPKPASSNPPLGPASQGLTMPQQLPMPGKHHEQIYFAPSQILPRNQLKKPLQETLRDFNKRSKAKVEMKTGGNGHIIFEGRGPVDATRQVLKDLAREIGSKQQVKVPIPVSVRPFIIGKQGAVIQGIQTRTGAKVQLPKNDVPLAFGAVEDDDSHHIDVSIEGDAVAAEMARREIESIVNKRTSTVNLRLKEIPAEFFPFLAGPHNAHVRALEEGKELQIQIPHFHTWSDQAPPQPPSTGVEPQFLPSPNSHIRIAGERLAAQEARIELERRAELLRRQITLRQMQIERGRHQFILDNDNSLHDFLQETGCAIVFPPATEDTETLTITGPQDRIESGTDKAMDLALAMQMSRIDIARQHAGAPLGPQAHALALTRYLQHRQAVQQLEQQYNAHIALPSNNGGRPDWEIYVKDGKNGMRAKQDILALVNAHPPARIKHVQIDPFFHQHVHQQSARNLEETLGVVMLKPEADEGSDHIVLVYEGIPDDDSARELPRLPPSPDEFAVFERALHEAQEHVLSLLAGQQDLRTAPITSPPKFRERLRKYVEREQQALPARQPPVQLSFDSHPTANGGHLRGPSGAVEDLASKIAAFIESEERDELERGHVTSFEFPQKHISHLIGRKGETVNKYREEYDVDIEVKEGKVDIIGPKAKADAARAKIIAFGKQLDDESTHVLKINPKYHREIIGARGSQVNHLQDKYNVRVQFPRSASNPEDDKSVADEGTEASGQRHRRPNQGPDEVIVKGPSKGANAAKDELLSLLQWTIDNSQTAVVSVAQKQLPSLIGSGGQEMEAIRLETGAQIDIPGKEGADASGRVQIQLKGTKKQVADAKAVFEQRSKAFDDTVTRSIDIDRQYHRTIIGSGGANLRNIIIAAGGSDDRRQHAKTVRFPHHESEGNTIQVTGEKRVVDKIITALQSFASEKAGQTTIIVDVAPEKHRILIGRGGETRKALESQFGVEVNIPRISEQGSARSQVKVSGQPADVEAARARILDMIKDVPEETVQVPRKYHHAISDNGQLFRRLRNQHGVTVDHGDHRPPQKPSMAPQAQMNGNASMPLITDEPDSAHSFSLVEGAPLPAAEEGDIPWILKGSAENTAKARAEIEKALKASEKQKSQVTGYLTLPDPRTYRFIIGHGGSKINEMRKQTGCKITVPRGQTPGGAVEIVGDKQGVEEARDLILQAVNGGGRRQE